MPISISFRGIASSDPLRDAIREHLLQIGRVTPGVLAFRITIESDDDDNDAGCRLRVLATTRDGEIEACGTASSDVVLSDPYVAVAAVFDDLARRMQDGGW